MENQGQVSTYHKDKYYEQAIANFELSKKVKDIKICMLSTLDAAGKMNSRPMYTHQIQEDGVIWFFTGKDSKKVLEINSNPIVNLNYSDTKSDLYVTINGKATITDDQAKVNELWNEMLKAWFPEGVNDPNIALIRVEADEAEYWDTPNSAIAQLIGYVKATFTGKEYNPGENKKINL